MGRYVRASLLTGDGGAYFRPFSELVKILDAIEEGKIDGSWAIDIVHLTEGQYANSKKAFWQLKRK